LTNQLLSIKMGLKRGKFGGVHLICKEER
jgi:hypothetical protein